LNLDAKAVTLGGELADGALALVGKRLESGAGCRFSLGFGQFGSQPSDLGLISPSVEVAQEEADGDSDEDGNYAEKQILHETSNLLFA